MSADIIDDAGDAEALARDNALLRHAQRSRIVPMCESCDEVPAHVTDKGTIWRFCVPCAEEHLGGVA